MSEVVLRRARGAAEAHAGVRIETGVFGPWLTNAYLVWDGRSTHALVLDPGMGASVALLSRASEMGLRIHLVANSHGHIDHVFDNAALVRETSAPLAIHPDDAYRLTAPASVDGGWRMESSRATSDLVDGEQLRIGDLRFDVLHTPGHTEGSVCLYEERQGLLLSGDTLFAGAWGRTDLPGGDDALMAASLGRLATTLPVATRVLPGHGPETTIERELPWLSRVARTGRLPL